MEQQEITVYAAITISGPLVYHLIRWNVTFSSHDLTGRLQRSDFSLRNLGRCLRRFCNPLIYHQRL
jgi:hypothetical protein